MNPRLVAKYVRLFVCLQTVTCINRLIGSKAILKLRNQMRLTSERHLNCLFCLCNFCIVVANAKATTTTMQITIWVCFNGRQKLHSKLQQIIFWCIACSCNIRSIVLMAIYIRICKGQLIACLQVCIETDKCLQTTTTIMIGGWD